MAEGGNLAKKSGKKSEVPVPGEEPRQTFLAALDLTVRAVKDGLITVTLDSDGDLEFEFDYNTVGVLFSTHAIEHLSSDQFTNLLTTELPSLLRSSIYRDPMTGLKRELPLSVLTGKEDEFLWRVNALAEKNLVSREMKERFLLRKISKGPVLGNLTWDVGLKTHDEEYGALPNIPVAHLCFAYALPRTGMSRLKIKAGPLSFDLPVVNEPGQLAFEVHRTEVKGLIDDLNKVLEKLKELEGGRDNG